MLAQGGQVARRAVAFIRRQSVDREDRVPFHDHAVALDLGQDGRSGDRGRQGIAVNDRLLRKVAVEAQRVHQQVVGSGIEAKHRFPHGQTRGLVNIDLIDAGGIDGRNRPGDGMLADSFRQNFAPFRRQQLGIAQTAYPIRRIEDHGGSDDRTKQ